MQFTSEVSQSGTVNATIRPSSLERKAFPGRSCPAGESRAAVVFAVEEAVCTPQCSVQMELTRDLEGGLRE